MFRTTTTYLQYHNNICSVPQEHMFGPNTSSLLPRKGSTPTSDRLPLLRLLLPLLQQPHVPFAAIIAAPHISNASAASISTHHCGAWLRTEYDTAVIRAHNAVLRTILERMATPSPTTTHISRMVVARARSTKALKIKWEHSF